MKNTLFRNTLVTGLVGIVAFGAMNVSTAQDIAAPKDVAAAPADAEKTASGLMSKILKAGTGKEKPGAEDTVTVHYSGWETSGKMFDSSVARGEPASFPLNRVIKGWTEGLQLMVVGEKRRFWIPANLAYGDTPSRPGGPSGMLCFDVELLDIVKAPEPIKVPEAAVATASGVKYVIMKAGEGAKAAADKNVKFHYTFFSADGKPVQSSKERGDAQTVPVSKLPPFFSEVLTELSVGGLAEIYVPGQVLGAQDPLVKAELELVAISEPIPAPAVPQDVAAVPADAKKTDSGLAYKVIKKGEGGDKPAATNTVTVHYTGWETSGEMFDSSVTRGETTSFALNQVIPGWTEGLQLMSKGDTYRFWIPEGLAYGPKQEGSGRPGGLLVFDVELVGFK
ncbi:MAG: FKBP-type peptidyl-prolyl cis-trans isomerase [Akkermansiaceae bacterium]